MAIGYTWYNSLVFYSRIRTGGGIVVIFTDLMVDNTGSNWNRVL